MAWFFRQEVMAQIKIGWAILYVKILTITIIYTIKVVHLQRTLELI